MWLSLSIPTSGFLLFLVLLHKKDMQRKLLLFITFLVLITACAPRPQYKTAKGKKKLKHYNSIQYQAPQP
jgi:uncharacterized lipoprotein YajG